MTRVIRCVIKVSAVVFTTILAPVLVNILVSNIKSEAKSPEVSPVNIASPNPRSDAPEAEVPEAGETIHLIVQGVGKTSPEALEDALRTALVRAVAEQVDPDLPHNRQALAERLLGNHAGLIRGWRELRASKEWKLRGTVHHREVAVQVHRPGLLARLRAEAAANPRK